MSLAAFRAAVEAGLTAAEDAPLFSSAHWLVPWLDHYGRDSDRFTGTATAPLPMMIRRRAVAGLPVRELRFAATGDDERDEVCTEFSDLHAGQEDALRALLERRDWDLCSVENVTADSRVGMLLASAGAFACAAGSHYRIALPDTVAAWEASLGKSSRAKVRRTRRDMQARALQLTLARGSEALALLPSLVALHQARWQARGETGVFASARFHAFHEQLLARPGSPALIALLRDEQAPMAAWYGFDHGGCRYFYQSGFSAPAQGHFSPGLALHLCLIEDAIHAGLHGYDFMKGGEQSYKSRFAAEQSPMWHWRLPGRSVRGRLLALGLSRSRHWQRPGRAH